MLLIILFRIVEMMNYFGLLPTIKRFVKTVTISKLQRKTADLEDRCKRMLSNFFLFNLMGGVPKSLEVLFADRWPQKRTPLPIKNPKIVTGNA